MTPIRYYTIILGQIAFVLISAVAMVYFPGGADQFPDAKHYLFTHNYFSDLGLPQSPSGETNTLAQILFAVSLVVMSLSMALFYLSLSKFGDPKSMAATLCTAFGLLSALGVFAAGFTPYTIVPAAHRCAVIVWLVGIAVATTLYITFAGQNRIKNSKTLSMLLVTQVAVFSLHSFGYEFIPAPIALMQKLLVYTIVIWFISHALWFRSSGKIAKTDMEVEKKAM